MEKRTGNDLPSQTMKSSFKTALQTMMDGDGIRSFGEMKMMMVEKIKELV